MMFLRVHQDQIQGTVRSEILRFHSRIFNVGGYPFTVLRSQTNAAPGVSFPISIFTVDHSALPLSSTLKFLGGLRSMIAL